MKARISQEARDTRTCFSLCRRPLYRIQGDQEQVREGSTAEWIAFERVGAVPRTRATVCSGFELATYRANHSAT